MDSQVTDQRQRWRISFWCTLLLVFAGLPLISYVAAFYSDSRLISVLWLTPFTIFFCFLGGYIGFGNRIDRWIYAPLASMIVSAAVGLLIGGNEFWIFVALGALLTLIVAIATFFLRSAKGELLIIDRGSTTLDAFQFGIKDLMILTTIAAVTMPVGRFVISVNTDLGRLPTSTEFAFVLISCVFCLAFPLFINFWSLFGQELSIGKLVFNCAATLVSTIGITLALPGKPWWPITVLANQILFGVLMWMLRKQGVRFVKR